MKRSLIYIILLLVLSAVALYLYTHDQKSTMDPAYTHFGIRDRGKVDSVMLQQADDSVKLHRKEDTWFVNENTYARDKAIQQLFNLLEDIRIEAPAPEKNRDELLGMIQENPVRVRIYDDKQLIRDYWVEQSPAKEGMTYMMVQGSRQPFLMHLPGFQGDLAPLFRVESEYWRDRTLFDYSGPDLKTIEVMYPADSASSFMLAYHQDQFVLKTPKDPQTLSCSSNKAARYFSYFANVRFESVVTNNPLLADSLRQSQPYCTIELQDVKGKRRKLLTYRKESTSGKDAFGQQSPYDLNLLYGRFEDSEEILLIKYTEIDPLLKEINYFREN